LEPSISGSDDIVWIGAPDEWFSLGLIVLVNEAVDGRLQINDRSKDAMLEASARQFGEETFDCIQP